MFFSWLYKIICKLITIFSMKKNNKKGLLYKKIWLACLSACLPVIFASGLYYQLSMDRVIQNFKSESQFSLSLSKTEMERVLQGIESSSLRLANNPLIYNSFTAENFYNDIFMHSDILNSILLEKSSNDFMEEIYYYNEEKGLILSNRYGTIAMDNFKYKDDIRQAMKNDRQVGWYYLTKSTTDGYISFITQLPIPFSGRPQGVLISCVNKSFIENYLQGTFINKSALVLDSHGSILFHSNNKFQSPPFINRISEDIINIKSDTGSFFINDSNGRSVLLTYVKTIFGRTYILLTSKEEIALQIGWIRWATILTLLSFIGMGLILTVINFKRVYNPIEQLMNYGESISHGKILLMKANEIAYIKECFDYISNETETLRKYVEKVEPTLRDRFLQELLEGNFVNSKIEEQNSLDNNNVIFQQCRVHNIPVGWSYVVMNMAIEHCDSMGGVRDTGCIEMISIVKIVREILNNQELFKGYSIYYQAKGVVILCFNQSFSNEDIIKKCYSFATSIQECVFKEIFLSVSIGIGGVYPSITDITISYNEANQALQYRIYRDTESILYIDDVENTKHNSMGFYPHDIAKIITYSLENEEIKNAEEALTEFTNISKSFKSYSLIYQFYQILLSLIISSFQEKGGSILDMLENNLFDQLKDCTTSKEIHNWFIFNLFPQYNKLIHEKQSTSGKAAILSICKYIKDNIDKDISLIQCSELVNMSPSYISRLFKKETGISFLDYVMKCKVEKIKKMLMETDYVIGDIAKIIGYSERNLYRMFQSHTNMSPNDYRVINR